MSEHPESTSEDLQPTEGPAQRYRAPARPHDASLVLSESEIGGLGRCITTLVSPLAFDSPDIWRLQASRQIGALLGTSTAIFLLDGIAGIDPLASPDYSTAELDAVRRYRRETNCDTRAGAAAEREVLNTTMLVRGDMGAYYDSAAYQEWLSPLRIADSVGFDVRLANGVRASPRFNQPEYGTEACADRGIQLCRLLAPALRAGLTLVAESAEHRARIATLIDRMDRAVIVIDARGNVLHESLPVRREVDTDSSRHDVWLAARRMAAELLHHTSRSSGRDAELPTPTARVSSAGETYSLHAVVAPDGLFGTAPVALVTVKRLRESLTVSTRMARRYQLTSRQVDVALLLTRGATNKGIARALRISEATARHHVEAVMTKTGARTRGAVVQRLLDAS